MAEGYEGHNVPISVYQNEDEILPSFSASKSTPSATSNAMKFNSKGGTIPSDARRSLKQLLPVPASIVLNDAIKTVKKLIETEKYKTI